MRSIMLAAALTCAAAVPALAQDGEWSRLAAKVVAEGEYSPPADEGRRPAGYTLEAKSVAKGSSVAEYVSVWGREDDGGFIPRFFTMVSERWSSRLDGDKEVDQWVLTLELDGTVREGLHRVLVLRDRTLVDERPLDSGPAAQATQRDDRLAYWLARR